MAHFDADRGVGARHAPPTQGGTGRPTLDEAVDEPAQAAHAGCSNPGIKVPPAGGVVIQAQHPGTRLVQATDDEIAIKREAGDGQAVVTLLLPPQGRLQFGA